MTEHNVRNAGIEDRDKGRNRVEGKGKEMVDNLPRTGARVGAGHRTRLREVRN